MCSFDKCRKKFKTNGHLTDHITTHYKVKPFSRRVCNRLFRRGNSLKEHFKTHSGEKPFLCTFMGCEKKFAKKNNMKIHFNSHFKKNNFNVSLSNEESINSSIFFKRKGVRDARIENDRNEEFDNLSSADHYELSSGNFCKNSILDEAETLLFPGKKTSRKETTLFYDDEICPD